MWPWKGKKLKRTLVKILQNNTDKYVKLKQTPRWERTDDIQGHKPKFKIHCFHCQMPMGLRHSVITNPNEPSPTDNDTIENIMSYKCARCAWFIRFSVLDTKRYLKKIVNKYRRGFRKYIPKWDDDSEESALIRKQLAALGYWAGRIDDEEVVIDEAGKIIGFKKVKKHVESDGKGGLVTKDLGEEIIYLKDKQKIET